ncbi:MAG: Gfo/Idh/MocA family oxidoreductase, partial [Phycisphaerales bacterium]
MTSRAIRTSAGLTRRGFLKRSAIAGAAVLSPTIVPGRLFGAEAPSNLITMGFIGVGRMGLGDLREILGFKQARVVAVCDVDANRVQYARELVEKHYGGRGSGGGYKGCAGYGDFRDLIGREDIDAVAIATPDHWHVLPAIAAAQAGKDIFLQKPFSLTIEEGRVLSDTVRRYGRVFQVGSQQRS